MDRAPHAGDVFLAIHVEALRAHPVTARHAYAWSCYERAERWARAHVDAICGPPSSWAGYMRQGGDMGANGWRALADAMRDIRRSLR